MSNNDKKRKEISFEEYQKVMKEMADSAGNPMSAVYFFILLFTIGIILSLFAQKFFIPYVGYQLHSIASMILLPYVIIAILSVILFILKLCGVFKSLRCPKCRRFFPKGKLELYTSVEGSGIGVSSGGDYYSRASTAHVYWTECKYCGYIIWVTKGG